MTGESQMAETCLAQGDEDLETLYQLAARSQVLRVPDAVQRLGWRLPQVVDVARRLVAAGLLQPLPGDEPAYTAVAPRAAASRRLAPLHSQIEQIERRSQEIMAGLAAFQEVHDQALREAGHGQAFRLVSGAESVTAELAAATAECRHELLCAQPGGSGAAGGAWRPWEHDGMVVDRGVRVRALYPHSVRFSATMKQRLGLVTRSGGEVRTLGEVFDRMTLFDRETAFIPAGGGEDRMMVVRQPVLVEFLAGVFERSWLAARPFASHNRVRDVSQMVSGVRMSILRLLAEGETDEAIARQVGLSVRTCRSHIAKIYQEFGARSRFHLGVLIAGSGLLDTEQAAC